MTDQKDENDDADRTPVKPLTRQPTRPTTPESRDDESEGSLTVLMMASNSLHPGLKNAKSSLDKHEIRYQVLGLNEKWGGWPHRMKTYRDAAQKLAEENPLNVVVCMDAYDALSVRHGDGLMELFRSFDKPLVLSLEKVCMGNCVSVRDWWRTDGQEYLLDAGITDGIPPADRYVNGGLLMGYAGAVRDLYDWMLKTGQEDDQKGLARYALAHRDRWAPDVQGRIFKNKVFGAQLTKQDLASEGVYFAHFPGMRDWSGAGYDKTVLSVLKRPSGVSSKNLGSPSLLAAYIVALVITCVALLFLVYVLAVPREYKPTLASITASLGTTLSSVRSSMGV